MTFLASDSYSEGRAPESSLTRLRLGDEIFSSRDDSRDGVWAGFIINQQGAVEPLPRPTGPSGPLGRKAGGGAA